MVQPQQVRREPTKVSNSVQTWRMQTFLQGQGIFDLQTLQTRTRASILCNYYFKVSSTRSLTFVRSRDLRFTPNRDEILLQVLPEEAMMFTHDTHRQHSERLQHHQVEFSFNYTGISRMLSGSFLCAIVTVKAHTASIRRLYRDYHTDIATDMAFKV